MSTSVEEPLNLVPVSSEDQEGSNGVNGATNGVEDAPSTDRFDPKFTDSVINATGPKANPRMKKVLASLTRHLHDFCRENEITIDEYMAGIDMVERLFGY